jgi:hypothetical protein
MIDDCEIKKLNETEIKNLATNCYSCIKENGKKINYTIYINSNKNKDCNDAILRIFNKIDIVKICQFINDIEGMSNIRKEFYKKIITLRYEIIEKVYNKLK